MLAARGGPGHGHTAGAAGVAQAAARAGASAAGPAVPQIGLVTVRPRPGETVAAAALRLRAQPGVAAVEPVRRMQLRELPNDPGLNEPDPSAGSPGSPLPAGTPLQWPLLREGFPAAWDITRGQHALVGVIDTGIDATHPDLSGKIDALVDQQLPGLSTGPAGTDSDGHGTHVASLACAQTTNALGIAGAGHDCRLVVEKSDLTDASIAASIVDATDRGAQAINMSFGDDGARPASEAIRRAIRYASHRNVVLVAAAADEAVREQGDPANLLQPTGTGADLDSDIGLSVTAATYGDARASFAGMGSQISLAAYGAVGGPSGTAPRGLLGAFPAAPTSFELASKPCGCRATLDGDGRYGYLAGTSMAAPQVTAVAALVRSLNPDLSAQGVVRLLKRTARRAPGAGWSPDLGWGILDAAHALQVARTLDRHAPYSRVTATRGTPRGQLVLRVDEGDPAPPGVAASGVRSVEIDVTRISDGRLRRVILRAGQLDTTIAGKPGERYAISSRATDRAGNRERPPARADAVIRSLR